MSDSGGGLSLSSRVVPAADVLFRDLEGESVLLDLGTGRYFGLDELGTRIWELLSPGESLERVHRKLLDEYEVGAEALERDLLTLVRELLRRGLAEIPRADAKVAGAVEERR